MNAATALARQVVFAPAIEVFEARCKARAWLCREGDMDFQSAVDGLQASAVEGGLVAELGQDAVQMMMAEAVATVPRPGELEKAFRELVDVFEALPRPRSTVAASTISAAKFLVQQGNPADLNAWLKNRSARECDAIWRAIEYSK